VKYVGVKEAWEDFANAIVMSAVKDYEHALRRLKRHPESRRARDEVRRHEAFFYSDWFESLTWVEPSYLIRNIKERVGL